MYLAHNVENPGVLAKPELHLLMTIVLLEDLGPGGPGVVVRSLWWRWWQDLKCGDVLGSLKKNDCSWQTCDAYYKLCVD